MTDADSALVTKVKALLHELEVGEDFTVDHAATEVQAELDRLKIRPDANYERALDLCFRAFHLLDTAKAEMQSVEWLDAATLWLEHFSAEVMLAHKNRI